MEKETKFYLIDGDRPAEEIKMNKDNMFFVQMYASIRCAFLDYDLPLPKYAYIDKAYEKTNHMDILLVMENSINDKFKYLCVKEELDRQAQANYDEDYMTYRFEIC